MPTAVPSAPPAPPAVARMFSPSVARFGEGMGEGAQSMGRQALSALIVAELQQAKLGYMAADAALSGAGTAISTIMQQQREQMTALLGGKYPFIFIRDAGVQMTKMISEKAGQLEQAAVLSASATERADQLRSACDGILSFLNGLNVPQVDIPGVGFLVDELRGAVDSAKSMGMAPVQTVKNHADEVGEFLQIFANIARQQVAAARQHMQSLSEGLAKCNSFEDVINLFMGKLQEILGTGTNLQIEDVRAYWASIGTKIDEGITWAQGLASDNPPDPPDPGAAADGAPPESAAAAGGCECRAGAAQTPGGGGAAGARRAPRGPPEPPRSPARRSSRLRRLPPEPRRELGRRGRRRRWRRRRKRRGRRGTGGTERSRGRRGRRRSRRSRRAGGAERRRGWRGRRRSRGRAYDGGAGGAGAGAAAQAAQNGAAGGAARGGARGRRLDGGAGGAGAGAAGQAG